MRLLLIMTFFVFSFVRLYGQSGIHQRQREYNVEKGVAIQGYDPVAYVTENKAAKGSDKIKSDYKGVTYYFTSQQHKSLFDESPEKYEPQYGGWCAYAMGSDGTKVKIDPETFKIIDGKLYLFYNFFFNNTLTKWNDDEENLHKKADVNWNKIIDHK